MTASDGSFASDVDGGLPLARVFADTIETLARRRLGGDPLSDAEIDAICAAIVADIDTSRAALRRLVSDLAPPA